MRKETSIHIDDKTALKVMREEGLLRRTGGRGKYRPSMSQVGKPSPNLLARNFKAEDPTTRLTTYCYRQYSLCHFRQFISPSVPM